MKTIIIHFKTYTKKDLVLEKNKTHIVIPHATEIESGCFEKHPHELTIEAPQLRKIGNNCFKGSKLKLITAH